MKFLRLLNEKAYYYALGMIIKRILMNDCYNYGNIKEDWRWSCRAISHPCSANISAMPEIARWLLEFCLWHEILVIMLKLCLMCTTAYCSRFIACLICGGLRVAIQPRRYLTSTFQLSLAVLLYHGQSFNNEIIIPPTLMK